MHRNAVSTILEVGGAAAVSAGAAGRFGVFVGLMVGGVLSIGLGAMMGNG